MSMRSDLRAGAAALGILAAGALPARADEGMWTFDNFPAERMRESVGWAPDAAWRDRVMATTARLPQCTGAVVSGAGLLLTNQHCIVACLTHASTPDRNLVVEGYAAPARESELSCGAMPVQVLESISDVTPRIEAAAAEATPENFARVRDRAIADIVSECGAESRRCEVMTLYGGGRYALYRYHRYTDVRLVFAPEYAAAQFGGDADNFKFPRTSVDFAFLRLYERGAPARTPQHLSLRFTPPAADEVVLVAGNPGATSRLKSVAELNFERDVVAPWREAALEDAQRRLQAYAARGADEAILSVETLENVANNAEAYAGRRRGLADAAGMARVAEAEADLRARVARNQAAQREVGAAWDEIAAAQQAYRGFFFSHQYAEARAGERSDLFAWARDIVRGAAERGKPEAERLPRYAPPTLAQIERWVQSPRAVRPDWEAINLEIWLIQAQVYVRQENPELAQAMLGGQNPAELAQALSQSRLIDPAYRAQLWAGGADAVAASEDPMIQFVRRFDDAARTLHARYQREVEAPSARASERIARVRFRAFGETAYPDATFSPRLSFGRVRGWTENGADVAPFTYISDLYSRVNAQHPLPQRWLDARRHLPAGAVLNFVADADIISGNSGSALLDRDGKAVGVVFDGNDYALGGEYYYDGARNRAISVSSQAIGAVLPLYGLDAVKAELEQDR